MKVWQDIEMIIDPGDGIGGNLAFIPQLFDRWERAMIDRFLPRGGVFVDVGANIGAYSLWAAKRTGREGRVLAYEAEPDNFSALAGNITINGFEDVIVAQQVGVADFSGVLDLRLNTEGNSGGHSFADEGRNEDDFSIKVACEPLGFLIKQSGVDHVDFMKLDIEGFEKRVLSQFFIDVPSDSLLRPDVILAEVYYGDERDHPLISMIEQAGYELSKNNGLNCLFRRHHF
jgi:FkbM family methyltransferase